MPRAKSNTSKKTSAKKSTSSKSARSSKKSKTSTVSAPTSLTRSTDRSQYSESTWVVFRSASERKPMLFNESLSRDEVRGSYSKLTGTSKDNTRSRRLKNY